jgi:predicted nucleic acid-binding Zn ribbon protein
LQDGVVCPRCGDHNAQGNTACASWGTPLTVSCVFCGAASPLGQAGCVRYGEAFHGALERKRQRDEQAQMVNLAGQEFWRHRRADPVSCF